METRDVDMGWRGVVERLKVEVEVEVEVEREMKRDEEQGVRVLVYVHPVVQR